MNNEQLKEIIVALINNGYFPKYAQDEAGNLAKDVASFQKAYYDEIKK